MILVVRFHVASRQRIQQGEIYRNHDRILKGHLGLSVRSSGFRTIGGTSTHLKYGGQGPLDPRGIPSTCDAPRVKATESAAVLTECKRCVFQAEWELGVTSDRRLPVNAAGPGHLISIPIPLGEAWTIGLRHPGLCNQLRCTGSDSLSEGLNTALQGLHTARATEK